MADTVTAHYGWVKPEITGSPSTWGNKWNSNLDLIDTAIFNINADLPSHARFDTGGTFSAAVHSSVSDGGGDQLITHDQVVAIVTAYMPVGIISLWSGSTGTIPAHWHLCDGTSGTPDLRDKFVVGAGNAYAAAGTGGAVNNTPTITVAGHALTTAELAAHNHGVNDPGHGHGITDPGHSHGIAIFPQYNPILAGATNVNLYALSPAAGSTAPLGTTAAATGISVLGNFTGISTQSTGSGTAHNHAASSSAVPTLPPYYALAYIMRV